MFCVGHNSEADLHGEGTEGKEGKKEGRKPSNQAAVQLDAQIQ
jgi:hypothetical protein